MVTCTGKSLIPINFDVFQTFMNSVVPSTKLPEFNIKLDGRANSKATFAKLSGIDLTIYTGTIVNLGAQKFSDVEDAESLVMLFTIYGVKKAGQGGSFEIKSTDAGIAELKSDPDYRALLGSLNAFMSKFRPLNAHAISMGSVIGDATEKASKAKSGVPVSPYKDIPLTDVPQIEVPADLDLRYV